MEMVREFVTQDNWRTHAVTLLRMNLQKGEKNIA